MAKPKGLPKTGGRQKGVPNKVNQELAEKARDLGIDPFTVLLLFAGGMWKELGYESAMYVSKEGDKGTSYNFTIDPSVRAKCAAEACQYILPKKKAIELSTKDNEGFTINIVDYGSKEKK